MSTTPAGIFDGPLLKAGAVRFALLAGGWWILTEGAGGWMMGLVLCAAVTAVSLWLHPASRFRIRLLQLPGFVLFFLIQSLSSGWDVAQRTLKPDMHLQPGFVRVPLTLPTGAPTWWLMLTLNLLPGTLNVRLDGQTLELHCLDVRQDIHASVAQAEARLARLFVATDETNGGSD